MTDFNEELVREINSLRTNPKKYARTVAKYVNYFKGKILRLPGSNAGIKTEEGPDAYREAADFLSKQPRIEALEPSKGLCRIAEDFISAVQQSDPNDLGSIDMEEIINKYGSFGGSFSRAMDFGGETPEQALVNLIVSDGDTSRGQRESLLSTEIKRIGVANGDHETYRHCTAIVTCTEFENAVDDDDNGLLEEENPNKYTRKKDDENEEEPKTIKEEKRGRTEEGKGRTTQPKKQVLQNKDREPREEKRYNRGQKDEQEEEGDEELPPGVASINKTEKIVMENGRKKRITKVIKIMEDGSKQVETSKEVVEE